MKTISQQHPHLRGKLAISLNLTKRPLGVSQVEALDAGGGIRLAAQINKLKAMGHRFRDAWEQSNGSRYKRYWWERWAQPSASTSPPRSNQPQIYSENL